MPETQEMIHFRHMSSDLYLIYIQHNIKTYTTCTPENPISYYVAKNNSWYVPRLMRYSLNRRQRCFLQARGVLKTITMIENRAGYPFMHLSSQGTHFRKSALLDKTLI